MKKSNIKTWIATGDEIETIKALVKAIKFKEGNKEFMVLDNENSISEVLDQYEASKHCLIIVGKSFESLTKFEKMKQNLWQKIKDQSDICFCRMDSW